MSGELQIEIHGDDFSDEERARVARELRHWIGQNVPECRVEDVVTGPPKPGQKGAEIAAGTLALLITSGTVKALVECIATYIRERRRTVKLGVTGRSGAQLTLAADNLGNAELDRLVGQLVTMASVEPPPQPTT